MDFALKELEIIAAQTNARLGLVGQFIATAVALAGGVLAYLASATQQMDGGALLGLGVVFWTFALLILREDFQMVSHDEYYYAVRTRIREYDALAFRFPLSVKSHEVVPAYKGLTMLRYAFPSLSACSCVGGYYYTAWPVCFVISLKAIVVLALLLLNGFLFSVVFWGLYKLRVASLRVSKSVGVLGVTPTGLL
jgi:hypothetical protein